MSSRNLPSVLVVVVLAALLLAGCQPVRPLAAGAGSADAWIEQRKAEALAQELNTFDLMIAQDWEGYDAVTDPQFYQLGPDGAYIERDAMMAGLMDEKLVVRAPDLGEMRVEMITPSAYMVTYPLIFFPCRPRDGRARFLCRPRSQFGVSRRVPGADERLRNADGLQSTWRRRGGASRAGPLVGKSPLTACPGLSTCVRA